MQRFPDMPTPPMDENTKLVLASGALTEEQMRAAPDPWPKSIVELSDYITDLVVRQHDYGTCVYAMSLAAVAAFHYAAHKIGATGFQASMAELDFVGRTRSLKHGFMIVNAENLMYPQCDLMGDVKAFLNKQIPDLKVAAQEKLKTSPGAHPNVVARWTAIANGRFSL